MLLILQTYGVTGQMCVVITLSRSDKLYFFFAYSIVLGILCCPFSFRPFCTRYIQMFRGVKVRGGVQENVLLQIYSQSLVNIMHVRIQKMSGTAKMSNWQELKEAQTHRQLITNISKRQSSVWKDYEKRGRGTCCDNRKGFWNERKRLTATDAFW